jgi:DNA modification methylase
MGRSKSARAVTPVAYLETGVIHCADNKSVLAEIPSGCIDLIYLDPPFFSNKNYEVIWGDEAEVRSFEDRWEGGIQVYTAWMRERAIEMHRVLKSTGSIYLHCDWHASHYLKVMMDTIFGANNFQNEIAWCYEVGGRTKKRWARKHDTILFYSKTDKFHFDWKAVAERRKDGTHMKANVDEDGREYQEKRDAKTGKVYRYYMDEGTIPPDWWIGPQQLNREAAERIGYPTQKPEALLEKIIAASSAPGDIVLDPFCGCGTAIAVAHRLDRAWLGIDISPTALGIMRRRLEEIGAKVSLQRLPVTEDDLRELRPFEFQNWVIQRINGTHSARKTNDLGIDGYSFMEQLPVQVKQSDRLGRIAVDNFETAIERYGAQKGYLIAFSFTRNAREEVARVKAKKGLEIELVEISTLVKAPPDKITPELSDLFPALPKDFIGLPLPQPRPKRNRPSLEELVRSDRAPRFVQADE